MATQIPSPALSRRTAILLGGGSLAAAVAASGQHSAAALDVAPLDANKAVARRVFEEAINYGNVLVKDELFASDYVDRGAVLRQMPGPAGMPLTIDDFHALVPNVYATVGAEIAEGDLVMARITWHGEHPPAGSHVVGRTMHLFRIENRQIVEEWSAGWDWLERFNGGSPSGPGNPLIGA